MLGYLLNVCYVLLLAAFSPWLLYLSIRKGKYREGWGAKLLGRVPVRDGKQPCIWLHAVSVGEVQLLAALIQQLQRKAPDVTCVISTTTRTGYALATKKYRDHLVFYCPLDFTWAVKSALRRIRPRMLVLAELELWPNLISAAHSHGIPIAVVNGRLSEKSYRGYRRLRPLVARMLRLLDLIAAQNADYAARFVELGADPSQVVVTGSIKFDGAQTDRRNPQSVALAQLAGFDERDTVFLAGSTQRPEESLAVDAFCALENESPQLRLVLVPRHPERFDEVARMLDDRGLKWQRRSELCGDAAQSPHPRILLVDTVGELGSWWGTAKIGFVGGSLGSRGGQNMIEPAAYGVAVSFGPNTRNFRDTVSALLAADAVVVVHDGEKLTAFVRRCIKDTAYADRLGTRAASLVAQSRGATDRTVEHLLESLNVLRAPENRDRKAA